MNRNVSLQGLSYALVTRLFPVTMKSRFIYQLGLPGGQKSLKTEKRAQQAKSVLVWADVSTEAAGKKYCNVIPSMLCICVTRFQFSYILVYII